MEPVITGPVEKSETYGVKFYFLHLIYWRILRDSWDDYDNGFRLSTHSLFILNLKIQTSCCTQNPFSRQNKKEKLLIET